MPKARAQAAAQAPHSWDLEHWPADVYPHTPGKGKYLVKSQREKLLEAGAITRVGRDLVVLGAPFTKFLESQASRVDGFQIAPNRERSATSGAT
jgi:hypothetical protein